MLKNEHKKDAPLRMPRAFLDERTRRQIDPKHHLVLLALTCGGHETTSAVLRSLLSGSTAHSDLASSSDFGDSGNIEFNQEGNFRDVFSAKLQLKNKS